MPTDHTDEHGFLHSEKPQITQMNADPRATRKNAEPPTHPHLAKRRKDAERERLLNK
jgi:hypothetical protein